MSLGEYVSVSSQRDSESALLAQERCELAQTPEQELAELTWRVPVTFAAVLAALALTGARSAHASEAATPGVPLSGS
jgi:vacuolar iron transporter family protein